MIIIHTERSLNSACLHTNLFRFLKKLHKANLHRLFSLWLTRNFSFTVVALFQSTPELSPHQIIDLSLAVSRCLLYHTWALHLYIHFTLSAHSPPLTLPFSFTSLCWWALFSSPFFSGFLSLPSVHFCDCYSALIFNFVQISLSHRMTLIYQFINGIRETDILNVEYRHNSLLICLLLCKRDRMSWIMDIFSLESYCNRWGQKKANKEVWKEKRTVLNVERLQYCLMIQYCIIKFEGLSWTKHITASQTCSGCVRFRQMMAMTALSSIVCKGQPTIFNH